ncbi:MAG TPA: TIR domain-containing protein [Polyangiaceae bacterium]
MSKIFLCYRRQDSAGFAGRIFDHVSRRFGSDAVFRDVNAIEGGADFVDAIHTAVGDCGAFILVIGPGWLHAVDANGRRRLDDPQDYVRAEVQSALVRGVRVIPALVDGARMPTPEELPPEISAVARRHAVELADARFEQDAERLMKAVELALTGGRGGTFPPQPVSPPRPPPPARIPIYMGWSIISLFMCPLVGPAAIRESNKCAAALAIGNIDAARGSSERARKWNLLALAASPVFWSIVFFCAGVSACVACFQAMSK